MAHHHHHHHHNHHHHHHRDTLTEEDRAARRERRERRRAEKQAAKLAAERREKRRTERALEKERQHNHHHHHHDTQLLQHRSRPSGRWTDEERRTGWLLTRSRQWSRVGRVKIVDKDGFMRKGAYYLDRWRERAAHEQIPTAEKKKFMAFLYALATRHGHVCGKWMVFSPVPVVDDLWDDICEANRDGRLGGCCKVCTYNKASGTHLICVYCRDFNDTKECQRVLYELHNICAPYGVRIIANFKADFLTALGVYKSRSSNVACAYTLKELRLVKEWPEKRLKRILDNLKRKIRDLEQQQEQTLTVHRTRATRTTRR